MENQDAEEVVQQDENEAIKAPNNEKQVPEEEHNKLKNQLMMVAADFENFKKRAAKEKEDDARYNISKFARDMIEVLENLYRAESSINTEELESNNTLKQIFTGVELTKKSLIDVFEKYNIKRIDPIDQPFNPDYHQAIAHVPSTTHEDGSVIQVIQAGYVIHDRLLRPALVAVAKKE
ncbi:MAG: nucleotide exchange factor GrpE [Alphaproteobacteria bacterium]|jgi:molecular chaperone GrpE|nr:nucleotide exchange factor GrpE [Candidatus Jidaibacter sp.]